MAGMDAEAVAQAFFEVELLRPRERPSRASQRLDAGRNKGADVLAQVIVSEEKPFAIDIRQVVGIDAALLGLRLARFAIGQFELMAGGRGFGQRIEHFEIQYRLGPRAKRNALLDAGKAE